MIETETIDTARVQRLAHYLLRGVNKANHRFGLLSDGDRVLVAVSGGKDSLTLLDLLHRYRRLAPQRYEVMAGHVRSDWHCGRAAPVDWLAAWCEERHIVLHTASINVAGEIAESDTSPCFRCAWNRRKALFNLAAEIECAKIAFGHHADDIAETTLMNLFFSGRVYRMEPQVRLFGGELTLIRPLTLIEERDIVPYARANAFPITGEPCPAGRDSKRALVKRVLREVESESRGVKRSIFAAVERCHAGEADPSEEMGG